MGFWEKAQSIDRRVIYLLLLLVIVGILLKPVGLAIEIKKDTQNAYNAVDKLPAGSIMWLGAEYDAASAAELMPAMMSVMRHAFRKDINVVGSAMWEQGGNMLERAWNNIKGEFPNKKYGEHFVNLGYKPGQGIFLQRMLSSVGDAVLGVDARGTSLDQLPLMNQFKTLKEISLVFAFLAGDPGTNDWVKHVTDPNKITYVAAATSVSVPGAMVFVQSGQMTGLIAGLSGSAEYEMLIKTPGRATAGMDAQSFTHVLVILFIIVGNLGYVLEKSRKAKS